MLVSLALVCNYNKFRLSDFSHLNINDSRIILFDQLDCRLFAMSSIISSYKKIRNGLRYHISVNWIYGMQEHETWNQNLLVYNFVCDNNIKVSGYDFIISQYLVMKA